MGAGREEEGKAGSGWEEAPGMEAAAAAAREEGRCRSQCQRT